MKQKFLPVTNPVVKISSKSVTFTVGDLFSPNHAREVTILRKHSSGTIWKLTENGIEVFKPYIDTYGLSYRNPS